METSSLKIPMRPLGSTGMKVSVLGLGTVKFGRNQKVKNAVPDGFALPSDTTLKTILNQCRDHGINLIDTAPAYGTAEQRLGGLLKDSRQDFLLCTKVGESFDGQESNYDFSASAIRDSLVKSRKNLATDFLDIVLVHCPLDDLNVLQRTPVLELLAEEKRKGHIGCFGVSSKTLAGGLFAVEHCDVVMLSFNKTYTEQSPIIERASQLKKGVFAIKTLQQGHLQTLGSNPIDENFRFVLQYPGITSAVAGSINPSNWLDNVKTCLNVTRNPENSHMKSR